MSALNEARAWTRSDSGNPDVSAAERDAYGLACERDAAAVAVVMDAETITRRTLSDGASATVAAAHIDAMLAREDESAERGGNPLVAAVILAIPAVLAVLWFLLGGAS